MSTAKKSYQRITTNSLIQMKKDGEKIAMLTAYDFTFAEIVDAAGIDVILVGDSASNVIAGHETTLPITLGQMIYHASSVVRAAKRSFSCGRSSFWDLSSRFERSLKICH